MPPTKKNLTFCQLRVGVFVLIALAVLALLILNATGDFNPFQKTMRLKARFASADGLREGAEVQFAGVHIGKVEKVKVLPPDEPSDEKIEAILKVNSFLDGSSITERIKTESTAQLIATSVLGNDKMINISPTDKGERIKEGDTLKSSTAISINQLTSTGNDLLGQINKLAVPANEILTKASTGEGTLGQIITNPQLYRTLESTVGEAKLMILKLQTIAEQAKSGDGTAGKLLNDPALYNNLNQTITKLESISEDIKAVSGDLRNGKGTAGKLLSDEALYTETRETIGEVKNAINDARKSVERLNKIADQVEMLAKDLNDGKGTAGKLLKDEAIYNDFRQTLAKINTTTDRVDVMLADAQGGKGTVGKLLTDDSLFNNINKVSGNVNQLSEEGTKMIYDFRQNPKKYLTIKLKLF
ncbi:MAG: MlaD family protein [Pyrinomonadaceae bacterium]|nr:MlaD family protein [Pyrinomonadaceae bacterium]